MSQTLLDVRHLRTWFPVKAGVFSRTVGHVKAVDDVSFHVDRGEVVGLVGESGSGKTTVGRTILRLIEPTDGSIEFDGQDVASLPARELAPFRRRAQLIFQDPFGSLNPRMRVADIVGEPLEVHRLVDSRKQRDDKVAELLATVGLRREHAGRYPHEFSGGQRQRIAIARALAVDPDFIVADEPVSALDVSIQAQVLNLLHDLRRRLGLTILFIAHDLAVVEYIADRIVVMYLGKVMESAPAREVIRNPKHPYTQALLSAAPIPNPEHDRQRIVLEGDVPSPIDPPSGCVFRTRCPYALPECAERVPELRRTAQGHYKACIRDDVL